MGKKKDLKMLAQLEDILNSITDEDFATVADSVSLGVTPYWPIGIKECEVCAAKENDAGENTEASISDTLEERGRRYGKFSKHAAISQALQEALELDSIETEPFMREALIMICHKLARIANGDPYYDDSWRDIAGYSQLVVDVINGNE